MAADIQRESEAAAAERQEYSRPETRVDHFLKSAASGSVSGRSGDTADENERLEREKRMCKEWRRNDECAMVHTNGPNDRWMRPPEENRCGL